MGINIETPIKQAAGKRASLMMFLAGVAAVLGHTPIFIWPAFIAAMAVLMIRLDGIAEQERVKPRAAFWTGYLFGFGYFLASLYWIASAFLTRGSGYVFLAPFGMLLMPAGLALFWGLAASFYVRLSRRSNFYGPMRVALHAVLFAACFFTVEYLRGHILSGFPWNLPGYIWEAGGAISQSAALFGIYGLSCITLLFAAGFGAALQRRRGRYGPLFAGLIIMASLYGFGTARLSDAQIDYHNNVRIRVVQTQIAQQIKYNQEHYYDLIDTYLELSTQPSDQPLTHIIWPEGAIPGLSLEDAGLMSAIDTVFFGGPTLIMGATRRTGDIPPLYYNSLVALSPTGTGAPQITARYNKSKLVPFGEYFPLNGLIAGLKIDALTQATASFNAGTADLTLISGLPMASVQICYEAIFSGFTPKLAGPASEQAQWILTISNDSWFGKSSGPHQHFNQVRYRAIEEGLPIVRAASSGVSGFVDSYGREIKTLAFDQQGIVDSPLPKAIEKPIFARLQN